MTNPFSLLLDDLVAQQNRAQPAPPRSRPAVSDSRPIPSSRPDRQFAKAVSDMVDDAKVHRADQALNGLRLGMGVAVRGRPAVFQIVDIDPAGGRVKVRQSRDKANDPAGVNFVDPVAWVDASLLTRMPDFDIAEVKTTEYSRILDLAAGLRDGEAKLADIQARGRKLVAAKRAAISADISAGKISSIEVGRAESLLNAFSMRLGI